ncbi:MAG TPA: PHP domain-containing protein, partial [Anaerolineaceae bacterium]|nr:PHP domain-containing protein [Anaerolineaceae bacterium]
MEELVVNLHIHSIYSDGSWIHKKIAEAAIQANLDAIIITDHNLLIHGLEGYYQHKGKKILVLIGEEIHDKSLEAHKNHLLTFGQMKELCTFAVDPQNLIHLVEKSGGLSFLAHPFENPLPQVKEQAIIWENWEVVGFTGLEIWNHLSELKNESRNWFQLLLNIFFPKQFVRGPHPVAVKKWDELLS